MGPDDAESAAVVLDPRSQERLDVAPTLQRAIFNSANFSSIATDAKGVIQIFNIGAERMLGYTAAEVTNRITPVDISDPQEVIERAKLLSVELATQIEPGFDALVFKASRGIENIYDITYIRKDGSRLPAVVSVTALRDSHDVIIGYLLISTDNTLRNRFEREQKQLDQRLQDQRFHTRSLIELNIDALITTDPFGLFAPARDITEREILDRALQETNLALQGAKRAAEKANLAKSDFLSSMSHELRSPLNAILGFAQLMESGTPTPTPAQRQSIDQILQSGWYLLELINEILDLSLTVTEFKAAVPAHAHSDAPLHTLLCVEDNPANLMLVEKLLERRPDIRLLVAKDGIVGVETARAARPDVILMDINLPGISGLVALGVLAEDPETASIPVIALSANAMPGDVEKGLAAGFFRYLTKPINVNKFMDTLDIALAFAKHQAGHPGALRVAQ